MVQSIRRCLRDPLSPLDSRETRCQVELRDKSMNKRHLAVVAITLGFSGCITSPKLDPPQQRIAKEQLGLSPEVSAPIPTQAWWHAFNDPQLDRLMPTPRSRFRRRLCPSHGAAASDRPGLSDPQSGSLLLLRVAGDVADPIVLARAPATRRRLSRRR